MEQHGYSVVRPLGHGGQGRVYEVTDKQGTVCVLKQLMLSSEGDKETALREVRLLSSLRHPCIVPYLDSFLARSMPALETEDVVCLIMSRCEHDLRHECMLRRDAGVLFEEPRLIGWLTELCWGLQHLHARKFLHRDLKPQNVLMTAAGRVLLADFGVAGYLDHTQALKTSIVGTPAFMSPEMLEGRPYGCKTDQWALGCVLYETMALRAPFAGCESYAAIVVTVLQAPPMRAPPGYGPDLTHAVEALMARKPDDRPSSAELLGSALLGETFRELLASLAGSPRGQERAAPRRPSRSTPSQALSGGGGPESVASEYEADFEAESSCDEEEQEHAAGAAGAAGSSVQRMESDGSKERGEWEQLSVEAEAWLHPRVCDPLELQNKIRDALRSTLKSDERVDRALEFLRVRRSLFEATDADELILQIEVGDLLGDEGLHALPLLEQYVALELRKEPRVVERIADTSYTLHREWRHLRDPIGGFGDPDSLNRALRRYGRVSGALEASHGVSGDSEGSSPRRSSRSADPRAQTDWSVPLVSVDAAGVDSRSSSTDVHEMSLSVYPSCTDVHQGGLVDEEVVASYAKAEYTLDQELQSGMIKDLAGISHSSSQLSWDRDTQASP